jgi:lauroyl/myristoyl acyltransferase
LDQAQEYLRTIRQEFGLDDVKSLAAEQSVIIMTMHSGRYDSALMLLQEMLPRSERLLGPTHRIVLAAKYSTGVCTYQMGDEEEGLKKIDTAIREAESVLGPNDSAIGTRKIETVTMLAQAGHLDLARERMSVLQADYSALSPDHFIARALQEAMNNVLSEE